MNLKKIQPFHSICFRGKSHFERDVRQSYLVFHPMYRYFKRVSGVERGNNIYFWKSKELSDENIADPTTNDYSVNPQLSYFGTKRRLEFKGRCLKQNNIAYDHGKVVNIYIVYKINKNYNISSYPRLESWLFAAVGLTKMVILKNVNILDVVLDLIDMNFFLTLVVKLVEM